MLTFLSLCSSPELSQLKLSVNKYFYIYPMIGIYLNCFIWRLSDIGEQINRFYLFNWKCDSSRASHQLVLPGQTHMMRGGLASVMGSRDIVNKILSLNCWESDLNVFSAEPHPGNNSTGKLENKGMFYAKLHYHHWQPTTTTTTTWIFKNRNLYKFVDNKWAKWLHNQYCRQLNSFKHLIEKSYIFYWKISNALNLSIVF